MFPDKFFFIYYLFLFYFWFYDFVCLFAYFNFAWSIFCLLLDFCFMTKYYADVKETNTSK